MTSNKESAGSKIFVGVAITVLSAAILSAMGLNDKKQVTVPNPDPPFSPASPKDNYPSQPSNPPISSIPNYPQPSNPPISSASNYPQQTPNSQSYGQSDTSCQVNYACLMGEVDRVTNPYIQPYDPSAWP